MAHRKVYAWRDPMPKPPDYLSPHCTSGNCKYCRERRAAKRRAATAALEAMAQPGMFWDRKIGGHQEQLGPSSPDRWLTQYVKDQEARP